MLKYRITYADNSANGSNTRDVQCGWINMPSFESPLIEFMGPDGNVILAVNPANVTQLELLDGVPVVADNKTFDSADGPPE